jgi:fumarylacetoacetate (FAA) hydrolase
MKLVTYAKNNREQLALLWENKLYDLQDLHPALPSTMNELLTRWEELLPLAQLAQQTLSRLPDLPRGYALEEAVLMAPVPHPGSCRDGYAFRQHVEAARRNRGVAMIPEFDRFPVFYFTNHRTIQGPGQVVCLEDHLNQLDYELEVAVVICREGKNIRAQDAYHYISGLMIFNDFSARALQMEEMKLNLGPAKGKDFATATGPWIVTTDELQPYEVSCKQGHTGQSWNLSMECRLNGELLSHGNLSDMDWTFAEIIERASYGATLYPGDIIGSGTIGTGCLLELNGTARLKDPDVLPRWLHEGDQIEMTVEALGTLQNYISRQVADYSILQPQKTSAIIPH